jgi:hypothetical protein
MTLLDLTGQESGIVVYEDKAVIVCNWASSCPNGGLPRLAPWGKDLIAWPTEINVNREYHVADIREALPGTIVEAGKEEGQTLIEAQGMDLVADYYGDIPALWGWDLGGGVSINRAEDGTLLPTPGNVYKLDDDVIVIAPEGWC